MGTEQLTSVDSEEIHELNLCRLRFFLSAEQKQNHCFQIALNKCAEEGHPCMDENKGSLTPYMGTINFLASTSTQAAFGLNKNYEKVVERVFTEMESFHDVDDLCRALNSRRYFVEKLPEKYLKNRADLLAEEDISRLASDLEGEQHVLDSGFPVEIKVPLLFVDVEEFITRKEEEERKRLLAIELSS